MAFAIQKDCTVEPFEKEELTALIPKMKSLARALCRDHAQADDLTQNALLNAWRHRDRYQQGTNLVAWVLMILRNQFYSDIRSSRRVQQLDPHVAEERLMAVSNPTAPLELEDVRRAMLQLREEQRTALTLIAVHGLGYAQVARLYNCAEGTIKSRVSRARKALMATLASGNIAGERGSASDAMASILSFADAPVDGRHGQGRRLIV